jgi:hypothetical protein
LVRYGLGCLGGDLLNFNRLWTARFDAKSFVECSRNTLATWGCRIGGRCSLFIVLDVDSDGVVGCWCTRFFVNDAPLHCGTTTLLFNGCCNASFVKKCV